MTFLILCLVFLIYYYLLGVLKRPKQRVAKVRPERGFSNLGEIEIVGEVYTSPCITGPVLSTLYLEYLEKQPR